MKNRVAIILPAYNEAQVIGNLIKELRLVINNKGFDYDVIVIDDGSQDNTHAVAKKAGAKVIRHLINIGVGGATATGLSYARENNYSLAATIDADGQHRPADLLKGIKILEKGSADLLIGSRMVDSSGMSRLKRIGNKGLGLFTHVLYGVNVTDSQSGLRIFSNKAILYLRWHTDGFEFCSEMLWHAKQCKLIIDEYPIKAIYTKYSLSKGQNNWNGVHIIKSLTQRRIKEFLGE